jgi:hypothetical protein
MIDDQPSNEPWIGNVEASMDKDGNLCCIDCGAPGVAIRPVGITVTGQPVVQIVCGLHRDYV